MYCNQCGNQIPDGSRFCSFCGTNLTAVQAVLRTTPVQSDPYFDIRHGVLVKYKGREKNVVVPAGVVEIEAGAFTGYDMESITIPEGCRQAHIDTFVEVIRFPATIGKFVLGTGSGSSARRCADHLYFAQGTKVIEGYSSTYSIISGQIMKLHIPSSVVNIEQLYCGHYSSSTDRDYYHFDPLIYDDIDAFQHEMRRQIYRREGKCQYCGGRYKLKMFGNLKCESCGRKKDYDDAKMKLVLAFYR